MRPHSTGTMIQSIVITNDKLYTLCPDIKPRTQAEVDELTPQQLMDIIREGGIVGMGGAAFPTHVKLSSGLGKVDTIIVNAGECEPYIVADDRLCQEYPKELISGLKIIMKVLGLNTAHIGIENNKPAAINSLKQHVEAGSGIILDVLPAKYPQGAEKQLIHAITGREVPSGGLPAAVGCAVFNAATCKAIHDAVYDGMPLIRRIVTVSGDIVLEPKNLMVPFGTTFNDLLEAVGTRENPYKVLSGGPMMGVTQYDLNVPVVKGTNAVTILGHSNRYAVEHAHCIRCGKCIEVCPMHLMPVLMFKALYSGSTEEMKSVHMMDCIECGCCAYTCPASVPLVLAFRSAKHILRNAAAKK
jgi:electron transport complex protein RnfC